MRARAAAALAAITAAAAVNVHAQQQETTWRRLTVEAENRCTPYDRDDYAYPQTREQDIQNEIGATAGGWYGLYGGTYRDAWDDAEMRTYGLNGARDRDQDGHACE